MKLRQLLPIILCVYFATSCGTTATPAVTPAPNPTATAMATNTPDPLVAQKAAMLYEQDFESGVPSGILIWSKWNVQTDDSGNHVFCNALSDNWIGGWFGRETWGDYAVEMKVKFIDYKPDQQSVAVDIRENTLFTEKYSGNLSYDAAELSYGMPYVGMGSKPLNPFLTEGNTWYTLRVEAAGNLIKYYLNQKYIAQKTDDHRQQGTAGFSVSPQTKVCVDDIRVWALAKDGSIAQASTQLPVSAGTPDKTIAERLDSHKFPKLLYQNWLPAPSDDSLGQAFYWDIIALNVDTITAKPYILGRLGTIRQSNPNAVILIYFSAADILPNDPNYILSTFISQLKPEWYMQDVRGKLYHLFPIEDGTWTPMFNLSTDINTFMPNFLAENVMKTGQVDGIFFDWIHEVWSGFKYRTDNPPNGQMDINGDGIADSAVLINTMMDDGTRKMLSESRRVFPNGSLIIGSSGYNGGPLAVGSDAKTDDTYLNLLNGRMLEAFLSNTDTSWLETMRAAVLEDQASINPRVAMFDAHGTENGFDHLRYTLASALMLNSYFAMHDVKTWFSSDPLQVSWWYDEYSVDLKTGQAVQSLNAKGYLGSPLTDAYNVDNKEEMLKTLLLNNDPRAEFNVWRRDFQNGIVLVNPSGSTKTIDLHGSYRKILGVKDPKFNDGSTVTEITLLPRSGIILLNMP